MFHISVISIKHISTSQVVVSGFMALDDILALCSGDVWSRSEEGEMKLLESVARSAFTFPSVI